MATIVNILLFLAGLDKEERRKYWQKRDEERRVKMMTKRYRNFW